MDHESPTMRRVTSARSQLILNEPFFGVLSLKLKVREREDVETAQTDGTHLDFNAKWIEKLTDMELQGLIAHEVMHCVHHHMTRRQEREPRKWNIACDHAINLFLLDTGFILPEGGVHDEEYRDLTSEAIYEMLDGDDESNNEPCPWGQVVDAGESAVDADSGSGLEVSWDLAVQQATEVAKAAGKLPAGIERLIDHLEKNQIDFRQHLWPFFTGRNNNDFTWRKPHRAYISEDEYFPSMYDESPGTYVIGMDTSGSCWNVAEKFLAEIVAIHEELRPERMVFIHCDAQVQRVVDVSPDEELTTDELMVQGGGGTSFHPVFEYVEQNNIEPEALVYLTDLEVYSYPDEPPYPVLWVSTTPAEVAPWGQTTYLLQ